MKCCVSVSLPKGLLKTIFKWFFFVIIIFCLLFFGCEIKKKVDYKHGFISSKLTLKNVFFYLYFSKCITFLFGYWYTSGKGNVLLKKSSDKSFQRERIYLIDIY